MNKYQEERCIGRGSYGCAYLVTEINSGKRYVVKKIPIELMTDKEKQQAFAEVDLLSKLSNPFVVQYKENFVEGTVLHIVMGYCDGGDLTARIKARTNGYFSTSLVMDWFVQMALAIKYLHQRHILHRDLKTSNIFLTSTDVVKLGDFGIARTLDSTMDHAKTVVGTPYYMSPEVCESKPYSYASDIWALGCVLYEVCALKHAFDAPNILMLIVKIIQHDFPPIPPCYPEEITTILKSLLNKDPEKRPTIDGVLNIPYIKAHIDGLRASGGTLAQYLVDSIQAAQITPVDSYDLLYEPADDSIEDTIRHPTPPTRVGWVDGSDEVEEEIEACFDKEELLKPNYESAYSEECSDSIHIDYGRKMVRRKALTIDQHFDKLRIVHGKGRQQPNDGDLASLPPLHPSSKLPNMKSSSSSKLSRRKRHVSNSTASEDGSPMILMAETFRDLGDSFVSNACDSDNDGPYTSMSDCDAEENFYSDDSDFDLDEHDFDDHVEHAYSDDFEDTEAEVIEYDNDGFSSDSETSSSPSPVKDQSIMLQSYSYDDDFVVSDLKCPAVPSPLCPKS